MSLFHSMARGLISEVQEHASELLLAACICGPKSPVRGAQSPDRHMMHKHIPLRHPILRHNRLSIGLIWFFCTHFILTAARFARPAYKGLNCLHHTMQVTWHGRNWDVLVGATAPVIAWLVATRRVPPRLVVAWNVGRFVFCKHSNDFRREVRCSQEESAKGLRQFY